MTSTTGMENITLSPTSTKPFKAIIHLADLHIRSGDIYRSKYTLYESTFNRLIERVCKERHIESQECLTVIAGDVFHYKNEADSTGIQLFNHLIGKLSMLCPIAIIQGNHDYKQGHLEEPGILDSLFYQNPRMNVFYLDRSANYIINNLGIGVISIKDVLDETQNSGQKAELPVYKANFPSSVQIKIALFHGSIRGCTLQNYQVTKDGYALDWIQGYDLGLFGDIHMQQVHNVNSTSDAETSQSQTEYSFSISDDNDKMPWGYPGSLLQQNYGEKLIGHGYLYWDLSDWPVGKVYIRNIKADIGMTYLIRKNFPSSDGSVNFKWAISEGKWNASKETREKKLEQLFKCENCPNQLYVSIKTKYTTEDIQELYSLSNKYKIQIEIQKGFLQKYLPDSDDYDWEAEEMKLNLNTNTDTSTTDTTNYEDYNDPKNWIKYIEEKGNKDILSNTNWSQWLINPEILITDDMTDDERKTFTKQIQMINSINSSKDIVTIKKLEWGNLFCYGEHNYIDFTDMKNKICLIEGDNSTGKSSLFDIICMTIYNHQIPNRASESMKNVINYKHQKGYSRLTYQIGDQLYEIEKKYKRNQPKNSIDTDATLYQYKNGQLYIYSETNEDGKIKTKTKLVDEVAVRHFGTIEKFLTAIMLTQTNDAPFFEMDYKSQVKVLDGAINTKILTDVQNFLRIAKNYYNRQIKDYERRLKTTIKQIETDICNASTDPLNLAVMSIEKMTETLTSMTEQATSLRSNIDEIQQKLHSLPEIPANINISSIQNFNEQDLINAKHKLNRYSKDYQAIQDLKHELSILIFKQNQIVYNPKVVITHSLDELQLLCQTLKQRLAKLPADILNMSSNSNSNQTVDTNMNININTDVDEQLEKLIPELQDLRKKISELINPGKPSETETEHQQWIYELNKHESIIQNNYISMSQLEAFISLPMPNTDLNALNQREINLTKEMSAYLQWYNLSDEEITNLYQDNTVKFNEHQALLNQHSINVNKLNDMLSTARQAFAKLDNEIRSLPTYYKPNITESECNIKIQQYNTMKAGEETKRQELSMVELKIRKHELYQQMQKDYEALIKTTSSMKCIQHYHQDCQHCNHDPKLKRERELYNQLQQLLTQEITLLPSLTDLNTNKQQIIQYLQTIEHFPINTYQQALKDWQSYHVNQKILQQLNEKKQNLNLEIEGIANELANGESDYLREQKLIQEFQQTIQAIDYIYDHSGQWSDEQMYIQTQKTMHDTIQAFQAKYKIPASETMHSARNLRDTYQNLTRETEKWQRYVVCKQSYDDYICKLQSYQQSYNQIQSKINTAVNCLRYKLYLYEQELQNYQYNQLEQARIQLSTYLDDLKTYNELQKLKEYNMTYKIRTELLTSLKEAQSQLASQERLIGQYQEKLQNQNIYMKQKQEEENTYQKHQKMYLCTEHLYALMDNYKTWLYVSILLPRLNQSVNVIANKVLPMESEFEGILINDHFRWLVKDKDNNVVNVKVAGGYRCFVYNLALRIAMSKVGCNIVNCNQLIIDEGFVAASEENQEKVEGFLKSILATQNYQTIILASHLHTIKKVADIRIPIQINKQDNTSKIQYGIGEPKVPLSPSSRFAQHLQKSSINESSNFLQKSSIIESSNFLQKSSINESVTSVKVSIPITSTVGICQGIKKDGSQCTCKMAKGYEPFCKRHKTKDIDE